MRAKLVSLSANVGPSVGRLGALPPGPSWGLIPTAGNLDSCGRVQGADKGRKARALPWTRWGRHARACCARRPQTPIHEELRGERRSLKSVFGMGFAGETMKSRAALMGVWGLRPQRVQGRALAFDRSKFKAVGIRPQTPILLVPRLASAPCQRRRPHSARGTEGSRRAANTQAAARRRGSRGRSPWSAKPI